MSAMLATRGAPECEKEVGAQRKASQILMHVKLRMVV